MFIARLRLAISLTILVASFHATATTRYWALTDVKFSDGAIATGYFSYDDVGQKITSWNLRVSPGPGQVDQFPPFLGFTYTTGNSESFVGPYISFQPGQYFSFDSGSGGSPVGLGRFLLISPLTEPDGTTGDMVLLNFGQTYEGFTDYFNPVEGRGIVSGSLRRIQEPPLAAVQVDEYYNPLLRHYFISADAAEKQYLDVGVHPGWVRTGETFNAYATGSNTLGSVNPTCRYYGDPLRGIDSHFYSADAAECLSVRLKYPNDWQYESDNVFQIDLPDTVTGACPGTTVPVYRLWNKRVDSNHRYTTRSAIKALMLADGYVAEGYGPDAVAMCAVK